MTDDSPARLSVAILAGGLATRLGPITEKIPKCLVEVAGMPFLEHQFAHLRALGLRRVALCVGHMGEKVRDFAGDGRRFGLEVSYSFDGEVPLGTGGALRQAMPLLSDPFIVLYGDSYLPIDFAEVARAFLPSTSLGCMTVFRNENQWDRSNAWFEDGKLLLYHKRAPDPRMRHIDYGLGLLRHAAFVHAPPAGAFDLAFLYESLVEAGLLQGQEVRRRFYEIGSPAGLKELDGFLRRPPSSTSLP
ncbi:MAG: nucleotidyl transferase [Verrucomicrobia bacterium]|nr:nucleotidyl transferase [Verrucomicrobiota bacterium]